MMEAGKNVTGIAVLIYILNIASYYTNVAQRPDDPMFYFHCGQMMAMLLPQISAMMLIVFGIKSSVHTDKGFYHDYRSESSIGNLLGFWDTFALIVYLTIGALNSIVGFVSAGIMQSLLEDRVKLAADSPAPGQPINEEDGYKALFLGAIVGMGTFIGAGALVHTENEMVQFWDNYPVARKEGTVDGTRDDWGTSFTYDFIYHVITWFGLATAALTVWLGAIVVGFIYMFAPIEVTGNCDLDNIDKEYYLKAVPFI